ncbi:MAG: hypothetical protein ABR907_10085 [Terracidiphilus sp.]|jgi:cytochrome c5
MTDLAYKYWLLALVVSGFSFASLIVAGEQASTDATGPAHAQPSAKLTEPGEKIFAANCARCHTPPMTLNPRVTGTVLLHMRVRAHLSSKDEKLLLQYLAP